MHTVLIGYGNVGQRLCELLRKNGLAVNLVVRSSGVYNEKREEIDRKENFHKYIRPDSTVFISTPSQGRGETSAPYYEKLLPQGTKIVTCEKAFLAYNWDILEKYPDQIKYSTTVGGASGILGSVTKFTGPIKELWAVVNGTLNYIGEQISLGNTQEQTYENVMRGGFAEPNAKNIESVIRSELQDVGYKAAILANHSKLCGQVITPDDFSVVPPLPDRRAAVFITKNSVSAGFIEPQSSSKLPKGINNCLYVNGEKMAEGPGAGGKITAETMYKEMCSNFTTRF